MLHKRFLFVSLLAPSFSFASTATDSLSGVTRDVFDNLDENPAFVNVEGGKSFLRIGKQAGAQLITNAGGFGLGVQVNSSSELSVVSGTFSSKDAPAAFAGASSAILEKTAETISATAMPLALTMGGVSGDIKWGLRLGYQSAKRDSEVDSFTRDADDKVIATYTAFDPTYVATSLRAGMIMGELEAALAWGKGDWKLATSRASHDGNVATADKTTSYMEDGVSAQSTTGYELVTRYQAKGAQWFLTYGQQKSDLKLWDLNDAKNGGSTYDAKDAKKLMDITAGGERSDSLTEGVKLLSKSWFSYSKLTANDSTEMNILTDMNLSTAHGIEVAAASWATLRAGVQASLWGSKKLEATTYETAGQKGKSETNTTSSANMLRGIASPTMGVGFKFGNYIVDATLAQDGTGSMGFSDKILGKVEVTAQF